MLLISGLILLWQENVLCKILSFWNVLILNFIVQHNLCWLMFHRHFIRMDILLLVCGVFCKMPFRPYQLLVMFSLSIDIPVFWVLLYQLLTGFIKISNHDYILLISAFSSAVIRCMCHYNCNTLLINWYFFMVNFIFYFW